MISYNRTLLVHGLDGMMQFIRGWTAQDLELQRAAMLCDHRIPASSIGYSVQLCSPDAAVAVRIDAAVQLSRFVDWDN